MESKGMGGGVGAVRKVGWGCWMGKLQCGSWRGGYVVKELVEVVRVGLDGEGGRG